MWHTGRKLAKRVQGHWTIPQTAVHQAKNDVWELDHEMAYYLHFQREPQASLFSHKDLMRYRDRNRKQFIYHILKQEPKCNANWSKTELKWKMKNWSQWSWRSDISLLSQGLSVPMNSFMIKWENMPNSGGTELLTSA